MIHLLVALLVIFFVLPLAFNVFMMVADGVYKELTQIGESLGIYKKK